MQQGLNKVFLIGSLAKEPEMRFTSSGRPVTSFVLRVPNESAQQNDETHAGNETFIVIAWGELAERCHELLNKGQNIYLEGRLQTRHWVDEAGNKNSTIEVIARDVLILDH